MGVRIAVVPEFAPESPKAGSVLIVGGEQFEVVLDGVPVGNVADIVQKRTESREDDRLSDPPLKFGDALKALCG